MDILEKHGIKIPNAVLVKYSNTETDDEVVAFLNQYGKTSKVIVITETDSDFKDAMVVEFESGRALVELKNILPYHYVCNTLTDTYDICELSTACSKLEGKVKTEKYLSDLQNLAKLTGQDYAEVLKGVMSLLGQSITEQSLAQTKALPDVKEVMLSGSSATMPAHVNNTATLSQSAARQDLKDEQSQATPDPSTQHISGPSPSARLFPDPNPPEIQRYVVEHRWSDDSGAHSSSQRLRSFSGRAPRPQHETDYETWRSGVDLLMKDPAVSDLQRSRRIFESLLPPAADMVKHIHPDTPPMTYLQILDSAYGTVQDGDELYAKFMELFQDAGEKPSAYLQRLQVALSLAVKRGGVLAMDVDRHLLNQFCRGCWDNSLISELQLKQRKFRPPSFAEFLLLLRTEEDREAAKVQRMKQHLGSKARAGAHAQYAYAAPEESKVDKLTTITQQLAQQLADIQKQLASLTSQSSHKQPQPTPTRPTNSSKFSEPPKTSRTPRTSPKAPVNWPKPGYCYNCGEDGHIKTQCDNAPNSSLVAMKKKQFNEKQRRWQMSNPNSAHSLN